MRGWRQELQSEDERELEDESAWPGKRSTTSRLQSKRRSPLNKSAAERLGASSEFHAEVMDERSPAGIAAQLGEGQTLDPRLASGAGETYGADLGRVRVHTNGAAAKLTSEEGARAFAVGEHIAFAPGQFQPGTPEGDALIAHELAHVVQQQDLGPAAVQRKKIEEDGGVNSAEAEADEAAKGVLSRLYGGAKNAVKKISQMPSKMALRRCDTGPALPADPLARSLYAKLTATPADLQGFYGDLAALNGTRANDPQLMAGFQYAISHGKLTVAQAFRAVAFLAYGPEAAWPLPVKNFAEGVDRGTYTVSGMPPGDKDQLRELCVRNAAQAADGPGTAPGDVATAYRNEFNARFDSSRFSALSSELDPTLDSKGPRSQHARAVFNEIYADASLVRLKTAYDTHTPPAFRELCDTFLGPDGTNLIASPRLQELRATLTGATVNAPSTADAAYTALVAVVTPKAAVLDARDRQEVDRAHSWRLAVDAKVAGPNPAISQTLRDDLWRVVTTTRGAAPVAPVAPAGPVAAIPPPVPNAAQTAFLHGITIAPTSPTQNATLAQHPLVFQIRGPANPGLAVNRHVRVEPAAQVSDGESDQAWANGAISADATINVDPQPTAGPSTVFTAHLTMPPLSAATFPDKTATVTVVDKRLDWFKTNIQPGLSFANFTDQQQVAANGVAHYTGGQCPIEISPHLGGTANPGLDIQLDGSLKKGGAVFAAIARASFDRSASSLSLFQTILREGTPPSAVPEHWELSLRLFQGTGPAVVHTIVWPFQISQTPLGGGIAADTGRMTTDNTWINTPIATAGFLLNHMDLKGGNYQRVARAVAGGALHIAACFVRSDSAQQVTALGGNPATDVAYAMGVVDPIGTGTNTLVAQPGAAGWRWGAHPGTVFLNATPVPGGAHRTLDEMADFLAHEGTHAADRDSGLDASWDSYATEFRAYWVMGVGAGKSTAFDPTLSGIGPKSERAQEVFHQVYGSSTYPFVKPAYDGNVNHFRERVDNYLFPDGINLVLSPQLADLRGTIEAYVSGTGTYPATKANVLAKYATVPAGDRAEITNNRMWRDLVETKFPVPAEQTEIKAALSIRT